MKGSIRRFVALFVTLALPAMTASAETAAVFHERADVSLIELPVAVTGRDGRPVPGLSAADFVVEDEGHAAAITAVDAFVGRRSVRVPDLPDTVPEPARRHFLFLFDLSFAKPTELSRSRDAAIQFVEHEMDAADRAAVGTSSAETGPRLVLNFTSDRRQIVAAIRSVGTSRTPDGAKDPLALAFALPGSPVDQAFAAESEDTGAAVANGTTQLFGNQARKDVDRLTVARISRLLAGMQSLAAALDLVEGKKRILYFSAGFDARLVFGSLMQPDSGVSAIEKNDEMANGWTIDVDERYANSPLSRQISDTTELFRRSDCVIYAVEIAGSRSGGEAAVGSAIPGRESLQLLAHETGGEMIPRGEDLSGALSRIDDQTRITYLLSFRPTVRLGEGKFHRLKVTLRQKGLHVSARAGYYETRAYRTLNPLERSLLTADVINGGGARGEIPVGALAIPLAGSGIARVPVLIQVPASSLQDSKHSGRVRIAIYVYLTDADGGLADYFSRNLTIDLAREGARLSAGFLRYSGACRLLPGRYTLRAMVQDEETGRYGFANASVNVPDYSGTRLQAFPPLFLGDEGRGLNLREPSSGGGGEEIFEIGGAPFVPQIDPPIPASGDSKICLFVYRPHGDGDRPFDVDVEILGDDGKSRGPARVALIGRTTADTDGLTKLMLDFSVRDLPPGRYSLKVTVRDSREKALESSSEAPFTVS